MGIPREAVIFSHNGNSKIIKIYKKSLVLSNVQNDVLLGTLLGDGHLQVSCSGRTARLEISHSYSSKDYVRWKKEIFGRWVICEPRHHKANNGFSFRTLSHPLLYKYQRIFYENGIKIIPKQIGDLLKNPLSLAVWFMDDGNGYLKHEAYRISTYAFKNKGNILLQECLYKNFGLVTNLVRDKKGVQLYIPIKNGNASKFKNLIEKYIIPSMNYKISQSRRD